MHPVLPAFAYVPAQVVQISAKGLQLVAFLVVMAELEETEVPGLHVCKRHLPVQVVSEGVGLSLIHI